MKLASPIAKRQDLKSRGGQQFIVVTCVYNNCIFLQQYTLRGQPYKEEWGSWFIKTKGEMIAEGLNNFDSLQDRNIGNSERYNLHSIFPFSSKLSVILQDIVSRRDFDGYIELVSRSSSGRYKEKFDAYVKFVRD